MFHDLRKGGVNSYFNLKLSGKAEQSMAVSGRCAEISPGGVITLLSRTDEETLEEGDLTIAAQRRAEIDLGSMTPVRCNPVVEVNPVLYESASVDYRRIYEERGEQEIKLYLRTTRKLGLSKLDWLIRIYAGK